MIVKKINQYKVIQDNPWIKLGNTTDIMEHQIHIDFEKYPKIFCQIYKFETGETIIQNDSIWRIIQKGGSFNKEVKCVQFNPANHLTIDIFPTFETANTELEKLNANLGMLYKDQNIQNILSQIKTFSNTDNLEELSFKELSRKLTNINDLVKSI